MRSLTYFGSLIKEQPLINDHCMYEKLTAPTTGSKITFEDGNPIVPNDPIIPFIRGDGTGIDIWPATEKVIDAAVKTAYGDSKKINWFKVYAGDEACDQYGTYQYLPEEIGRAHV